ncbi:MAG: hypothetical protein R6V57_05630 [Vicinamibacterales bacterium]
MDALTRHSRAHRARAVLVVTVGLLAAAGPALAQQAVAPSHGGFIFALGGGYAATKSDCSNCGSNEATASSGRGATYDDVAFLSASPLWRVNARIAAGAEVQFETSRKDARVLYVMGALRYRPWVSQGFFVRAGYGLVRVRANLTLPDGTGGKGTYQGVGLNYGIGWELFKDSRVSFAPFGAHYVSTLSKVTVGDFQSVNVIGNVWVAGVQVFFN